MDNLNTLPGNQPENEQKTEGMNRRQALVALGKLAIYTAPVLTTLTIKIDKAVAQQVLPSGPPSPPPTELPPGPPPPPN
uniref:hypothetical protein n=1 Tax=Candidatus Electronema sp. TaxID=2698783 RepID=UPI004055BC52